LLQIDDHHAIDTVIEGRIDIAGVAGHLPSATFFLLKASLQLELNTLFRGFILSWIFIEQYLFQLKVLMKVASLGFVRLLS